MSNTHTVFGFAVNNEARRLIRKSSQSVKSGVKGMILPVAIEANGVALCNPSLCVSSCVYDEEFSIDRSDI